MNWPFRSNLRILVAVAACAVAWPSLVAINNSSAAVVFSFAIVLAPLLTLGVPLFIFFAVKGWLKLWQLLILGAAVGLLALASWLPQADFAFVAFAAGVGAFHALLFWFAAVFNNLKPREQ